MRVAIIPQPTMTQVAPHPQHVFSKISRVPDLLTDGETILSLYTDADQVLHMQCCLKGGGHLVLFPVTFRLVNRYLSGDYTLAEVVDRAPCTTLLLVTRRHNLLELDKEDFDCDQLSYARTYYPAIEGSKGATVDEIRRSLHACMRGA